MTGDWARTAVDQARQDLRWTLRSLRRAPGFAFVAVAEAALGIGATTTAFTLLNHVLIRPLPFPRPHELVALHQTWRGAGDRRTVVGCSFTADEHRVTFPVRGRRENVSSRREGW